MCPKNTAYLPLESLPHQGQGGECVESLPHQGQGGSVWKACLTRGKGGGKSAIQTIQKEKKIFENGGQMDDDGQKNDGACLSYTLNLEPSAQIS